MPCTPCSDVAKSLGADILKLTKGDAFATSCDQITCTGWAAEASCASATAMSVVSAACVGKSMCTIKADDATFGMSKTPCAAGTVKRLAVQLSGCSGGVVPPGPAPQKSPTWIFDFGDNMAGFTRLTLPRSAFVENTAVVLRYAEVLNGDGSADMAWCSGAGADCHCSGINCANQTDSFIPTSSAPLAPSDDATVTYTPSFTYHGFRYVQVDGLASGFTPTTSALTALFVHSGVKQTGNITFGHKVLDGIQGAIVQTQKSNLHFHPTDCPQREKRGWTGDAQMTSRQASLNFDMVALYGSWLQTMADHDMAGCAIEGSSGPVFPQTNKDICCSTKHGSFGCDYTGIPNGTFTHTGGSVADVVPFMHVGGWPGDPSWGSVSTVLPYRVWKAGSDDALVKQFYEGAKANVDFFLREAADSTTGLLEFGYYGDWLELAPMHDKSQVTSMSQIMATSHLVEMAAHLGKTAEAELYNATLQKLRSGYHAKYWDGISQQYKTGTHIPIFFLFIV